MPEPVQQLFGRQRRGVTERAPAVGEQGGRGRDRAAVVVVLGGQQLGRGAGAVRPGTGGEVGDGDERFPGVGGPVLHRHRRHGVGELVDVRPQPGPQLGGQLGQGRPVAAVPERVDVSRRVRGGASGR